jgi:hypothetical protein
MKLKIKSYSQKRAILKSYELAPDGWIRAGSIYRDWLRRWVVTLKRKEDLTIYTKITKL